MNIFITSHAYGHKHKHTHQSYSQDFLRSYLCNVQVGSLLPYILINLLQVILVMVLVIYFHFQFYFRETIAFTDSKTMGAKHGIWCFRALHQWKVFLRRQGRTLTHASILSDITLLDLIWQAQLWKIEVHVKTLFMPRWALWLFIYGHPIYAY